ncbi:MAG: NDP-sugar synthase [Chloroflexota bacterium]
MLRAVILVGGEGTRLRPLTHYLPKPMVPVLNRPFLEHIIAHLKTGGVEHITLAMGYLPEAIRTYLGKDTRLGVPLSYTVEESPLGTAGAVKNAEPHLDDTFIVLNGDIFTDLNLSDMLAYHRRQGARATIALTRVDDPTPFGVVETGDDGRVRRFIEKPPADQVTSHWINAGIYVLEPEVLQPVPAGRHYMFERGLFPLLLEQGTPIYGYPHRGYWLDMGTPEKYLRLNRDLLLGRATSPLLGWLKGNEVSCGEATTIPASARVTGPVLIGPRCRIGERVRLKGPVVIGADCRVDEAASIEAAVLWDEVSIGAGARLKQGVVSRGTVIGENDRVSNRVVTPEHSISW